MKACIYNYGSSPRRETTDSNSAVCSTKGDSPTLATFFVRLEWFDRSFPSSCININHRSLTLHQQIFLYAQTIKFASYLTTRSSVEAKHDELQPLVHFGAGGRPGSAWTEQRGCGSQVEIRQEIGKTLILAIYYNLDEVICVEVS